MDQVRQKTITQAAKKKLKILKYFFSGRILTSLRVKWCKLFENHTRNGWNIIFPHFEGLGLQYRWTFRIYSHTTPCYNYTVSHSHFEGLGLQYRCTSGTYNHTTLCYNYTVSHSHFEGLGLQYRCTSGTYNHTTLCYNYTVSHSHFEGLEL